MPPSQVKDNKGFLKVIKTHLLFDVSTLLDQKLQNPYSIFSKFCSIFGDPTKTNYIGDNNDVYVGRQIYVDGYDESEINYDLAVW